jgi:hypothetical protein
MPHKTDKDKLEVHQEPGPHDQQVRDPESPGYEITDVNAGGIAVFLAGLFGSVLVFFLFCFVMGKVINSAIQKSDGPVNKWNQATLVSGGPTANGKRQDLASNAEMQQREYQQMTSVFPQPRLSIDDGDQETADLHAREDLLLDHYSTAPGEQGSIRIPITRAMELIVQRGLPVNAQAASTEPLMVGDSRPVVEAPLTSGFARTGHELDVMEARAQRMAYGKAESGAAEKTVLGRDTSSQ